MTEYNEPKQKRKRKSFNPMKKMKESITDKIPKGTLQETDTIEDSQSDPKGKTRGEHEGTSKDETSSKDVTTGKDETSGKTKRIGNTKTTGKDETSSKNVPTGKDESTGKDETGSKNKEVNEKSGKKKRTTLIKDNTDTSKDESTGKDKSTDKDKTKSKNETSGKDKTGSKHDLSSKDETTNKDETNGKIELSREDVGANKENAMGKNGVVITKNALSEQKKSPSLLRPYINHLKRYKYFTKIQNIKQRYLKEKELIKTSNKKQFLQISNDRLLTILKIGGRSSLWLRINIVLEDIVIINNSWKSTDIKADLINQQTKIEKTKISTNITFLKANNLWEVSHLFESAGNKSIKRSTEFRLPHKHIKPTKLFTPYPRALYKLLKEENNYIKIKFLLWGWHLEYWCFYNSDSEKIVQKLTLASVIEAINTDQPKRLNNTLNELKAESFINFDKLPNRKAKDFEMEFKIRSAIEYHIERKSVKSKPAGKIETTGKDETTGKGKDETTGKGKDETTGKGKDETTGKGKDETTGKGKDETTGKGKDEKNSMLISDLSSLYNSSIVIYNSSIEGEGEEGRFLKELKETSPELSQIVKYFCSLKGKDILNISQAENESKLALKIIDSIPPRKFLTEIKNLQIAAEEVALSGVHDGSEAQTLFGYLKSNPVNIPNMVKRKQEKEEIMRKEQRMKERSERQDKEAIEREKRERALKARHEKEANILDTFLEGGEENKKRFVEAKTRAKARAEKMVESEDFADQTLKEMSIDYILKENGKKFIIEELGILPH